MNLISQIIFAFLVTMGTGTLAYIIWRGIKPLCMRWHLRLPYVLLRIVCVLYVLPVGYIGMQIGMRDGYLQIDSVWQMNFAPVGDLWNLIAALVTAWVFFTGRQIRVCLFHWIDTQKINVYDVPEEDETVLAEFVRVKDKLHIHKSIEVYRNAYIASPVIQGIFFPRIILPTEHYDREQLSVIFHHELSHCKSGDLFYKACGKFINIFYCLGVLSEMLQDYLDEWIEYDCDIRTITAIKDEISASRYFEIIVESMVVKPRLQKVNHIFSGLYENQWKLGRRIDYMKKYESTKKVGNRVTMMMAVLFVLTNVTTVYAAGNVVSDVHEEVYQEEEASTSKEYAAVEVELEEFYLAAEEDDTYERIEYGETRIAPKNGLVEYYLTAEAATEYVDSTEMVMPALDEEELGYIDWKVSAGTRKMTTTFHVDAGQVIRFATNATPVSSVYWIGIMDEANNLYYVQGTGAMTYDFEIEEEGSYRVIVQNRSRLTLNVAGTYLFYTPTEEDTES